MVNLLNCLLLLRPHKSNEFFELHVNAILKVGKNLGDCDDLGQKLGNQHEVSWDRIGIGIEIS